MCEICESIPKEEYDELIDEMIEEYWWSQIDKPKKKWWQWPWW